MKLKKLLILIRAKQKALCERTKSLEKTSWCHLSSGNKKRLGRRQLGSTHQLYDPIAKRFT